MNADHQTSYTVEAIGTVPMKGLWDTAIDMHVVYQFKNPTGLLNGDSQATKSANSNSAMCFGVSTAIWCSSGKAVTSLRIQRPSISKCRWRQGSLSHGRIRGLQHEPQG